MNAEFSRREFFRQLTVIGATGLLLTVAASDAAPAQWMPAGKLGDFTSGGFRAVTLPDGVPVQIRRLPGRTPKFRALSGRCTHKGCAVAWVAADRQFRCPCHGGRFDAAGRNVAGPPPSPLPTLATRVVRGVVQIAVYSASGGGRLGM